MKNQKKKAPNSHLILVLLAAILLSTSCQSISSLENKDIQGVWIPSGWSCPVMNFCQQVEFQPNGKLVLSLTGTNGRYAVIAPGKIKLVIDDVSLVAEYRVEGETLTLSFKEGDQEYFLIDQPAQEAQQEVEMPVPPAEDFTLVTEEVAVIDGTAQAEAQTTPEPREIELALIKTLDARDVLERNSRYRIQPGGDLVAEPVFYFSAIFSADSNYLITSAGDNGEMVWDLDAEQVIADGSFRAFDLRVSSDDRYLLTETTYCSVMVSNPHSLEALDCISLDEGCTTLYDLHPSKNIVAVSAGNQDIALVELETGQVLDKTPELNDYPIHVQFSGDGKWLFAVDNSGYVNMFDSKDLEKEAIIIEVQEPAFCYEQSPAEPFFVYNSFDFERPWNGITFVNYLTQKSWSIDYTSEQLQKICFSPDGSMIAGLTSKGKGFLWDTHSGDRLAEIPIDGRPVSDIVFSKNEFLLAVTYLDGFIEIYEVMER